jgi:hypothetical protein
LLLGAEAEALARELLGRDDLSVHDRLCGLAPLGLIRVRRGEPGGWDCLDEATTIAQVDPPYEVFTRLARPEARDSGFDGEPCAVHVDEEVDYQITTLASDFASFVRALRPAQDLPSGVM